MYICISGGVELLVLFGWPSSQVLGSWRVVPPPKVLRNSHEKVFKVPLWAIDGQQLGSSKPQFPLQFQRFGQYGRNGRMFFLILDNIYRQA